MLENVDWGDADWRNVDLEDVLFSTIPRDSSALPEGKCYSSWVWIGSLRGVSDCNTAVEPCRPQSASARSRSTSIPHAHPPRGFGDPFAYWVCALVRGVFETLLRKPSACPTFIILSIIIKLVLILIIFINFFK
jgi:hypothetical protein